MSKSKKFDFKRITKNARELRKNITEPERLLWQELRGRKLAGYKFLRQHPILYKSNLIRYNYFIADFYCSKKKVVIELDGPIHLLSKDYDHFRDSELRNLGIKVIRIRNEELVDMKKVLSRIRLFLDQPSG